MVVASFTVKCEIAMDCYRILVLKDQALLPGAVEGMVDLLSKVVYERSSPVRRCIV
jgi:hypothetical protein